MIELESADSASYIASIVIAFLCSSIITLFFLFAVARFFIKNHNKKTSNKLLPTFSWQNFDFQSVVMFGLAFLIINIGLFGDFYAELWLGKTVAATYTHITTEQRHGKNLTYTVYIIHARLPETYNYQEVSGAVSGHDYYQEASRNVSNIHNLKDITFKPNSKIAFRVVPMYPAIHTIGSHADVGISSTVIAVIIEMVTILYFVTRLIIDNK